MIDVDIADKMPERSQHAGMNIDALWLHKTMWRSAICHLRNNKPISQASVSSSFFFIIWHW